VLLFQFIFNIAITLAVKDFLPYLSKGLWKAPKLSAANAKTCARLSFTFLLNVLSGMIALTKVNIPMFLAIRRLASLAILLNNALFLGKQTSKTEVFAVSLISVGALIAGANDLNADFLGYFFIILNNVFTAIHFQLVKAESEKNPELDAASQSFYVSLLTIPALMLMCFFFEDPSVLQIYDKQQGFLLYFVLSAVMGCVLTFSQNLCTMVNSPLATSITGNVKDIASTLLGLLLFPDVHINLWLCVGLVISLSGAMVYSYSRLKEQLDKNK